MENASKALLIAASVLIGILLLTLFAYVYTKLRTDTSEIYSALNRPEISKFNQKFLNYEGRQDLSIQDVVTIVNLAKDNNEMQRKQTTVKVLVNRSELGSTYKKYRGFRK